MKNELSILKSEKNGMCLTNLKQEMEIDETLRRMIKIIKELTMLGDLTKVNLIQFLIIQCCNFKAACCLYITQCVLVSQLGL